MVGTATAVPWTRAATIVALAVAGARLVERLGDLARFFATGHGWYTTSTDFWCALMSPTHSIGASGTCAPHVPVKWEEQGLALVYIWAATVLVSLTWHFLVSADKQRQAEKQQPAPPPGARSLLPLGLHGGWLVLHAYLDRTYVRYFLEWWLCTWCWWGTAVYAAVRLVEADRHAGEFAASSNRGPAAAGIVYACELSRMFWAFGAYYTVEHHDTTSLVLHIIPSAYMVLAAVLDERRRPRMHRAIALYRGAGTAAALACAIICFYGWIYDCRDLYSIFFREDVAITDNWPTLEGVWSTSMAALIYLWLYGDDGIQVSHGPAAGQVRRRVAQLAALLAVFALVPAMIHWWPPERFYNIGACPAPPVPIALPAPNAAAWQALAADLSKPVYVHGVVATDYDALLAELAALDRVLWRTKLRATCRGRWYPMQPTASAGGAQTWAWVVSLRRVSDDVRASLISDDRKVRRRGSLLLLIHLAPPTVKVAPDAVALASYVPSLTIVSRHEHVVTALLDRAPAAWNDTLPRPNASWCNDGQWPPRERTCIRDLQPSVWPSLGHIAVVQPPDGAGWRGNVKAPCVAWPTRPLQHCLAEQTGSPDEEVAPIAVATCMRRYFGNPLAAAHHINGIPMEVNEALDNLSSYLARSLPNI